MQMTSAKDYEKRVSAILGTNARNGKIHLKWNSPEEARLRRSSVSQMQNELRILKKEVGLIVKAINSSYTTEIAKVGKGVGPAFLGGLFGKKTVGQANVSERDRLRRQQIEMRQPYQLVNHMIDDVITQLDQLKLQIDEWIVKNSQR
jgi:hypothetical protein